MKQHPAVQHTLTIFEKICMKLPPLVPADVQKDMAQALEQMQDNLHLSIDELEDTIIVFGKAIWPYRKAFHEFLGVAEGRMGEKFLLGKVTRNTKRVYNNFIEEGGSFRDLHAGKKSISFFSPEERGELCQALIDVEDDIEVHTKQEVLSTNRRAYEERIIEFQLILDDMEKRLDTLRTMADNEQEHPELASEIRAQIRGFEYGLCALGPHPEEHAVCGAEDHFKGRKQEKTAHRIKV
ncbi:MAG: hypothetical protein HOC34_01755 [Candidatus Magasanikbacteria bacterium]|jgi:hypothetical protein|nr:hypothetical protein [Candidatus Magasanikbacteria bacterium]MBT4220876.1 hypothetical protein [Candidatus Magasanikbacteria bacterium]MBT4350337.1 hypothetical protein [Candidatus Magasanikbacteria bacterium]MBT4541669.1 hypothetical protein [Candidatus Magasanikbacteria bacterium]MBT6252803.1 hypothetical protein [Candidatus Magasanikbacteria bacterium]